MATRIQMALYKKTITASKQRAHHVSKPGNASTTIAMDYKSVMPTKVLYEYPIVDRYKLREGFSLSFKKLISDRVRSRDKFSVGYPRDLGDVVSSGDRIVLKVRPQFNDAITSNAMVSFKVKHSLSERIRGKEVIDVTMLTTTYFAEDYVSELYAVEPVWTIRL